MADAGGHNHAILHVGRQRWQNGDAIAHGDQQ
jgi:hypothetical protein